MVPLALASRFPEQWQREKWHLWEGRGPHSPLGRMGGLCRGRRLGEEFGVRISSLTTSPSRLPHPSPLFLLGSRPRASPTLITPQQQGFGRSAWTLDAPVTRRGVGGERSRGGITKARGAARGRGFPRGRESLGCGGDGGDRRSGRTMSMGSGKAGQHPHGVGSIFPKGGGQRQLGLQARRAATRRAPRAPRARVPCVPRVPRVPRQRRAVRAVSRDSVHEGARPGAQTHSRRFWRLREASRARNPVTCPACFRRSSPQPCGAGPAFLVAARGAALVPRGALDSAPPPPRRQAGRRWPQSRRRHRAWCVRLKARPGGGQTWACRVLDVRWPCVPASVSPAAGRRE